MHIDDLIKMDMGDAVQWLIDNKDDFCLTPIGSDDERSNFTNGSASVKWINGDEVVISSPYGTDKIMCGGDFEGLLSVITYAKDSK